MKHEPITRYKMGKILVHSIDRVTLGKRSIRKHKRDRNKKDKDGKAFKDIYERTVNTSLTYTHLKEHVARKQFIENNQDIEREF